MSSSFAKCSRAARTPTTLLAPHSCPHTPACAPESRAAGQLRPHPLPVPSHSPMSPLYWLMQSENSATRSLHGFSTPWVCECMILKRWCCVFGGRRLPLEHTRLARRARTHLLHGGGRGRRAALSLLVHHARLTPAHQAVHSSVRKGAARPEGGTCGCACERWGQLAGQRSQGDVGGGAACAHACTYTPPPTHARVALHAPTCERA